MTKLLFREICIYIYKRFRFVSASYLGIFCFEKGEGVCSVLFEEAVFFSETESFFG